MENKYNQLMGNSIVNTIFEKTSKFGKGIIAVLVFLSFLYISIWSILGTTTFKNYEYGYEFSYEYDNVIINIVSMILILVLAYTMFDDLLEKLNPKIFSIVLSLYVLIMGIFWITSVKSLPTSDCEFLVNTAKTFLNGDYSCFNIEKQSYYYRYPFQLGFVVWCQIFISIFKDNHIVALQIGNVISLIALYLAIIKIVDRTLNNKKITNCTILLFFGCIQGIMFTTLIYGNLSGFAFGIWSVYFAIDYIKTDKKLSILICAILLGISVMLKPNDMIIMVAICIVLLLKFLDTKKLFDIFAVLICFVVGNYLINIAVWGYETKTNSDLGDGMPKIVWVNIGLHESNPYYKNTYGWYNKKYSSEIFAANDHDAEITSEIATEQVKERLEYFKLNPEYCNKFFTEKILSQWNEPTYASIWVSERSSHYGEVSEFVDNVYYGNLHKTLMFFFNQYQQIIFIFACVFLGSLFKKKDISLYIMPLIILGGFLYHTIFEAKSQYVFTYVILLIPMAGYGINEIFSKKFFSGIKNLLNKCATEDLNN